MKYLSIFVGALTICMGPTLSTPKQMDGSKTSSESRQKTIEFTIIASKDLDDRNIEQYADDKGRVLVISFEGQDEEDGSK